MFLRQITEALPIYSRNDIVYEIRVVILIYELIFSQNCKWSIVDSDLKPSQMFDSLLGLVLNASSVIEFNFQLSSAKQLRMIQ